MEFGTGTPFVLEEVCEQRGIGDTSPVVLLGRVSLHEKPSAGARDPKPHHSEEGGNRTKKEGQERKCTWRGRTRKEVDLKEV